MLFIRKPLDISESMNPEKDDLLQAGKIQFCSDMIAGLCSLV